MMYECLVWTCCSTEDLKRVSRLQRRAAGIILEVEIQDQER